MDATPDEDSPPVPPVGSKAGRNESRKLLATLANNLCAAALIAGVLRPALTLVRQERPLSFSDVVSALVFGLAGLTLHLVGRAFVETLED